MVKIYFYPLEVVSKSRAGVTHIELYGRTMDNDQICVIDRTIKPHFYVIVKDSLTISKLRKLQILKDDTDTTTIPIILVSITCDDDSQKKGFTLGAFDFIPKPIDFERLFGSIQKLENSLKKFDKHRE